MEACHREWKECTNNAMGTEKMAQIAIFSVLNWHEKCRKLSKSRQNLLFFALGKKIMWLIVCCATGFLYLGMYNSAPSIAEIHKKLTNFFLEISNQIVYDGKVKN